MWCAPRPGLLPQLDYLACCIELQIPLVPFVCIMKAQRTIRGRPLIPPLSPIPRAKRPLISPALPYSCFLNLAFSIALKTLVLAAMRVTAVVAIGLSALSLVSASEASEHTTRQPGEWRGVHPHNLDEDEGKWTLRNPEGLANSIQLSKLASSTSVVKATATVSLPLPAPTPSLASSITPLRNL